MKSNNNNIKKQRVTDNSLNSTQCGIEIKILKVE